MIGDFALAVQPSASADLRYADREAETDLFPSAGRPDPDRPPPIH
jgi:hypothetical protein